MRRGHTLSDTMKNFISIVLDLILPYKQPTMSCKLYSISVYVKMFNMLKANIDTLAYRTKLGTLPTTNLSSISKHDTKLTSEVLQTLAGVTTFSTPAVAVVVTWS